ncbi:MAG: FG-GAP repeat protein [Alphaproteobacteria bacterium]|nr:FG-GAP repeat protein [Alphaproteobacteria bacterium]
MRLSTASILLSLALVGCRSGKIDDTGEDGATDTDGSDGNDTDADTDTDGTDTDGTDTDGTDTDGTDTDGTDTDGTDTDGTDTTDTDTDTDGTDTTDTDTDTDGTDTTDTDTDTDGTDTDADTDTDGTTDDGDGDGYTADEGDCDDSDASTYPGADEARDLADNDCDGFVDEDFIGAGDIVVNEIMHDPVAVSDTAGEWFELHNTSDSAIDLVGWVIEADDGDSITIDSSLPVRAGGIVLLGVSGDSASSGGVTPDYVYDRSTFSISNSGDSFFVWLDGSLVSEVEFTSTWDLVEGASLSLDPSFTDAPTVSDNWCAATSSFGDGDLGTPGDANDWCTDLDHDGDGETIDDGDCDDEDADVSSGADEVLDGVDNDCDGRSDNLTVSIAAGYLDGIDTDYLGWQNSLGVGDFDGDGQIDLVAGGTYVNSNGTGGIYVVDGAGWDSWAGDIDDAAVADIDGAGAYGYFGTLDQHQGDINGDGYDDVVAVGNDYYYSYYYGTVAGTIFLGSEDGITGDVDSGDGDIIFEDSYSYYQFTKVLSSADFDGDGSDDVLYGDYYAQDSRYREGYVYFFSGADLTEGETYDLQSDSDAYLYGDNDDDGLGYSLGGGDIDGDGYDDLALGAAGYDGGADNGGAVYLAYGRGTISGSGSISFVATAVIEGAEEDGYLGAHAQSQIADFDGDDQMDLAVAAPWADKVYIFLDAAELSGEVGVGDADITISGGSSEWFGIALDSGDLDGDGKADLVVGAPDGSTYNSDPDTVGTVYIYKGADLTSGALSDEDASASIEGNRPNLHGISVSVGDFSGDGTDDLLTAAPQVNDSEGRIFLFEMP